MKKHKRGEGVKNILTALAAGAIITGEILDHFLSARSHSYKAAHSSLYGTYFKKEKSFFDDIEDSELQKFYSLLNKLKREGFIQKKKSKVGSFWKITKAGLNKLGILKNKTNKDYTTEDDKKFKIIVFDVPEWERWKRAWLRESLVSLGFSMLQKSVWIGKKKIPEDFLEDLRVKRVLSYIHILEINASGTVKHLS